jgi:hypothetical protein
MVGAPRGEDVLFDVNYRTILCNRRSAAAAAVAARGQGGGALPGQQVGGVRDALPTPHARPHGSRSASPRLTACATAMRINGAKRGTAHVVLSSSEEGTSELSERKRVASSNKVFILASSRE